ncbi:hypothetical protein [Campylobacter showae]|uniref:hypothetical protein n=1 Tax=Campylobacter showae TaxID=204 RepID=UPI000C1FC159|nr:hypothetical protein [Campylobacter showae]DAN64832.1 MAG TPA: Lambda phage tail tube protein, TTP [Caudoviricetes sp.]
MPSVSTSPDYTGISVKVADLATNTSFPTTVTSSVAVGHLDDFPTVYEATREVKKYKPINDKDFSQMVSTGSVEYGAMSATVLYDPSASDGINKLEEAFKANKNIGLILELNNSRGANGTTYLFTVRLSKFSVKGEKDGKTQAEFAAEVIGEPTIKAAA